MAVAAGGAPKDLSVAGALHGPVTAGGSMAANVVLTGSRSRAVILRVGIAAVRTLQTTLAQVAGASGVATGIGRPSATERVAGSG